MLKHVLPAAILSLALASPAHAAWSDVLREEIAGWNVVTQQDAAVAGQPWRCTAQPRVPDGQVSLVVAIREVSDPAAPGGMNVSLDLYIRNTAWQVPANTSGQATIQVDGTARNLTLQRNMADTMATALPDDDASISLLGDILDGGALSVRLPNGQSFTVPSGSRQVYDAFQRCLQASNANRAARARDPFSGNTPQRAR